MTRTVHVPLGARAYDVRIGPGLIARAGAEIAPLLARPRVVIVTDANVAPIHLPALEAALKAESIASDALILPAGEATKSWPQLTRCVEWLEQKVERRDIVIALGGGVIDLVGFAAAILSRVRFVQMPTSLLAQVDSSVGGKTGINSAHGKNLIGAFHQPSLVLADTAVLDSLPKRDFLAGYGEVMKYGLLGDAAFFGWLEENAPRLRSDMEARVHAVAHSVAMKAGIVERDETEQGERALLIWATPSAMRSKPRPAIPTGFCMARAWRSAVRSPSCRRGWGCAARRILARARIWRRWGCWRGCRMCRAGCQTMP